MILNNKIWVFAVISLGFVFFSCIIDKGLVGLNHYLREFDFSDAGQLADLPSFGEDASILENGKLKSVIEMGNHKGLGRKFWFGKNGGEPNEAEMEFTIWLDDHFQKNGVSNEAGKFSGFEGIYNKTAGWGGKKVTIQNSWSVRIAHSGENSEGKIPLGVYVYHPGMKERYGTTVYSDFFLNREQTYTLRLYIKMNDINDDNGVLALFVDGNEVYRSDSWQFRKSNGD